MQQLFKRAMPLMGNHFELSVVSDSEEWAVERIEAGVAEIRRIEKLLTTYNEVSDTCTMGRNILIPSIPGQVFL